MGKSRLRPFAGRAYPDLLFFPAADIYQYTQQQATPLTALSATPEEKYNDFISKFPDLLSRLPLHMIASYLGISLKTLTRIRYAQWHR